MKYRMIILIFNIRFKQKDAYKVFVHKVKQLSMQDETCEIFDKPQQVENLENETNHKKKTWKT